MKPDKARTIVLIIMVLQGCRGLDDTQSEDGVSDNVLLSISGLKSIFHPLLTSGDSSNLSSYIDDMIHRFNMRSQTTTEKTSSDYFQELENSQGEPEDASEVVEFAHKAAESSPQIVNRGSEAKDTTKVIDNVSKVDITPEKVNSTFDEPLEFSTENFDQVARDPFQQINDKNTKQSKESKINFYLDNIKAYRHEELDITNPNEKNSFLDIIKKEILKKISFTPQFFIFKDHNQTATLKEEKEDKNEEKLQLKQENHKIKVISNIERPEKYKMKISSHIKQTKETDKKSVEKEEILKAQNQETKATNELKLNTETENNHNGWKNPQLNFQKEPSKPSNRENNYKTSKTSPRPDGNKNVSDFSQQVDSLLEQYKSKQNSKSKYEDEERIVSTVIRELQRAVNTNSINSVHELDNLFDDIIRKHKSKSAEKLKEHKELEDKRTRNLTETNKDRDFLNVTEPTEFDMDLPLYIKRFHPKLTSLAHIAGATALGALAIGAIVASPIPGVLRRSDDDVRNWIKSLAFWEKDDDDFHPPLHSRRENVFTTNIHYPNFHPTMPNETPNYNAPNYHIDRLRNIQLSNNQYYNDRENYERQNQQNGYRKDLNHQGFGLTKEASRGPDLIMTRNKKPPFGREPQVEPVAFSQWRNHKNKGLNEAVDYPWKAFDTKQTRGTVETVENDMKSRYVTVEEVNKIAEKSLLAVLRNYHKMIPKDSMPENRMVESDNNYEQSMMIPNIVHFDGWVPVTDSQRNEKKTTPSSVTRSQPNTEPSLDSIFKSVQVGYPPKFKITRVSSKKPQDPETIYGSSDVSENFREDLINYQKKYTDRYVQS